MFRGINIYPYKFTKKILNEQNLVYFLSIKKEVTLFG